jgi:hypothetical protein
LARPTGWRPLSLVLSAVAGKGGGMPADDLVKAFADAISEKIDAEEFERLMGSAPEKPEGLHAFWDGLNLLELRIFSGESALDQLRAQRALERLQARYPELWEQVFVE